MKTFSAGLQAVVSSSYDKTKTTILGRAHQKTINSQQVIGPALTNFIDTQTDASFIPVFSYFSPTTNRLFAMNVPASGVANIVLYNFDASTGAYSYVGKIAVNVPNLAATTHTLRGLTVNDTVSPFKIVFSTSGSVVINGGTFLVNGIRKLLYRMLRIPLPSKNKWARPDAYFCDEVYTALNVVHDFPITNVSSGMETPHDLWLRLRQIGE